MKPDSRETEHWLDPGDGNRLFCRRFSPPAPTAAMVLVHGFVEHSGRYVELAWRLVERNVAVLAFDLRGHGRSAGPRVWVDRFDRFVDDLAAVLASARQAWPDLPLFVFGHSLGGAIVARTVIDRQPDLRGVALSAPGLRVSSDVFPWLRRLALALDGLVPRLRLVRATASRVSRDPAVVAQFRGDPLVFHGRFPVHIGAEILRAGPAILASAEQFRSPVLVLHGTGDRLTDPRGSQEFLERVASTDTTLRLYPELWHDLLHEPEKEQVTADLIEWLDRRR